MYRKMSGARKSFKVVYFVVSGIFLRPLSVWFSHSGYGSHNFSKSAYCRKLNVITVLVKILKLLVFVYLVIEFFLFILTRPVIALNSTFNFSHPNLPVSWPTCKSLTTASRCAVFRSNPPPKFPASSTSREPFRIHPQTPMKNVNGREGPKRHAPFSFGFRSSNFPPIANAQTGEERLQPALLMRQNRYNPSWAEV